MTRSTVSVDARMMKEKELQREVIAFARGLGYKVAHFADSRRQVIKDGRRMLVGDEQGAGVPDLVLAGRGRLIFAELKTQAGTVSDKQAEWLEALSRVAEATSGVEVYIWRPSHWLDGTVEDVLKRTR